MQIFRFYLPLSITKADLLYCGCVSIDETGRHWLGLNTQPEKHLEFLVLGCAPADTPPESNYVRDFCGVFFAATASPLPFLALEKPWPFCAPLSCTWTLATNSLGSTRS